MVFHKVHKLWLQRWLLKTHWEFLVPTVDCVCYSGIAGQMKWILFNCLHHLLYLILCIHPANCYLFCLHSSRRSCIMPISLISFQTLTVGLVYHRPNDAIQFLIDGLEKLRPPGTDTILWDALLPSEVTNGQPKSLPHSAVLAEVSNDQPKSLPQSAPPSKKSKAGRRGD